MKSILEIGNSFGRDATAYLHDILKEYGEDVFVVNLYIGGCSLERHWGNIEKDARDYQYQENGYETDKYVSIDDMLKERKWDFVVTQQSSHDSGWAESYEPFAGLIIKHVKELQPETKIFIQKTWAYEPDSDHHKFMRYHRDQKEMFEKLSFAYDKVSKEENVPLIPCGDVVQALRNTETFNRERGGISICRDGFHMHYLYGRYALSLTWAKALFGFDPLKSSFIPKTPGVKEEADGKILDLIRKTVSEV